MSAYSKTRFTSNILLTIVVLAGICWVSTLFFFRLDFTADKRYTLDPSTRDLIKNLQGNVSITAFFTNDLPPDIAKVKTDFKEMLSEYGQLSRGKINFRFTDPSLSQEEEQSALSSGIQPMVVNVREKDQVKQQKVYLGATLQHGEQSEVIPFIQPGAAMEFALSSAIKKISVTNKPVVGFLQGHGEPDLSAMPQLLEQLSVLYQVEPVTLTDSTYDLAGIPSLMVVAPTDTFTPVELSYLDRYLSEGGKMLMAVNGVEANTSSMQGSVLETGMREWLDKKGLVLGKKFIIDAQCANVGVTQQQGGFTFQTQIPFPYFPQVNDFEDHPITKGLESVMLQFPANITEKSVPGIKTRILARTSDKSGSFPAPLTIKVDNAWTDNDFKSPPQSVVALSEGNTAGKPWKLVLISSGDFATNGSGQRAQEVPQDNISLMANSIDWLTDQTGLMELRTKQVTSRPLDPVSEERKLFIKYLNFLLPLILVLAYGIFRIQKSRNTRMRRMTPGVL